MKYYFYTMIFLNYQGDHRNASIKIVMLTKGDQNELYRFKQKKIYGQKIF